ncbi:MAG: glycosyltransferase [Anaerolineaceae bacterium]|nr:glycosyltransferase [Anaerolineaceae bacterium]
MNESSIAVLIPCYNEALSIGKVIADFRRQLPEASIYVFDNNSRDDSAHIARQAGATVIREKRQGKGFVVAAMLRKVSADYYVMVDGDDTYPAECARALLQPLLDEDADMVVGQRLSTYTQDAFRPLHLFGNKMLCALINAIFGTELQDPMSGYRAFTRDLAESLPVVAKGFDIETEMTLQMAYLGFTIKEIEIPYRARPQGSTSKLRTFHDGFIILIKILSILKAYKPLTFFGSIGLIFATASLVLGAFVIHEYIQYQYIYSVPKAILAASLMTVAGVCVSIGLIINTLNFRLLEMMSALSKQVAHARRDRHA